MWFFTNQCTRKKLATLSADFMGPKYESSRLKFVEILWFCICGERLKSQVVTKSVLEKTLELDSLRLLNFEMFRKTVIYTDSTKSWKRRKGHSRWQNNSSTNVTIHSLLLHITNYTINNRLKLRLCAFKRQYNNTLHANIINRLNGSVKRH